MSFFENLPPFRFILKFFGFFRTLLVIANKLQIHLELLLFSTNFGISVRFGDVEIKKWAHSVSSADKISLYFPSIKIFRVFCQKEEDLLPLFHQMLEDLFVEPKDYCSLYTVHKIQLYRHQLYATPLDNFTM